MPILYLHLPKQITDRKPVVSRRMTVSSWLHDQLLSRVKLNGQRTFGYHAEQVNGDGDAFNSLNYSGQGGSRFTDIGQAQVSGRSVFGVLNFDAQMSDNRFGDPQGRRMSLNYEHNGFSADLGDINGHLLNSNMFASFSKSLKGAMVGYKTGSLEFRAVRSSVKGAARTVSIQGNGGLGPYYLNANQIIQDSEQVQVDGQLMRLGQDYTMDYQVGTITFITRPVAQTSTIVASFEELGVNSGHGTIQGAGVAYSLGSFGKVGFTHVQQAAGGQAGLGTRSDLFQGFGAPETPYFLQFEPLSSYPIVVQLDGRVQIAGIDYRFDTGNPSIFYFLRYIPDTSTIQVTYTPKPTSTVNGDRRVTGWDYQLPFKGGLLSYSQATGSLTNTPTPTSGTARGINFNFGWKKWTFQSGVRDVPQSFVGIETQGFNRNERSSNWLLSNDSCRFRTSFSGYNSAISSRVDNGDGTITFQHGRATKIQGETLYNGGNGTTLNLNQARITSTTDGNDTKLDQTTLSANKAFGKLTTQLTGQRTAGSGLVQDATGNASQGSLTSNSIGLSAKYPAGRGWFLGGKYDIADTRSESIHGLGTDQNLSIGYHPATGWFSSDLNYSLSRSGTIAALSQFSNGLGFGYDGGGFSSSPTGTGFTNGPTDSRILSLVSEFKLGSRSRLDTHITSADQSGSVSSNTKTIAFGAGFQTELGRSSNLAIALENNNTSYIGSTQSSRNTTLETALNGSFGPKWSYQISTSMLLASGGDYSQNRWAYDSSFSRRLSSVERLTLQVQSGRSFGYQPQTDGFIGLSYAKNIFSGIALVGSYRIRNLNYLDGNTSTGGYHSRGFDVELSFDFGR